MTGSDWLCPRANLNHVLRGVTRPGRCHQKRHDFCQVSGVVLCEAEAEHSSHTRDLVRSQAIATICEDRALCIEQRPDSKGPARDHILAVTSAANLTRTLQPNAKSDSRSMKDEMILAQPGTS